MRPRHFPTDLHGQRASRNIAMKTAGSSGGKTPRLRKRKIAGVLDPRQFARPVAHRGLHDKRRTRIENTAPAFQAAIDKGYGIECDLQPASDGTPMVFHDTKLNRLVRATGNIAARSPAALARLRYRRHDTGIVSFAGLLSLVDGRVPLLVEVKAEGRRMPPQPFLASIAAQAAAYHGPIALMSFNADVVAALARLAPSVPRGLVVGTHQLFKSWLARARALDDATPLARLLDAAAGHVGFFALDVRLLKAAASWKRAGRRKQPLFAWTIRTKRQRAAVAEWGAVPIFEGYEP